VSIVAIWNVASSQTMKFIAVKCWLVVQQGCKYVIIAPVQWFLAYPQLCTCWSNVRELSNTTLKIFSSSVEVIVLPAMMTDSGSFDTRSRCHCWGKRVQQLKKRKSHVFWDFEKKRKKTYI